MLKLQLSVLQLVYDIIDYKILNVLEKLLRIDKGVDVGGNVILWCNQDCLAYIHNKEINFEWHTATKLCHTSLQTFSH